MCAIICFAGLVGAHVLLHFLSAHYHLFFGVCVAVCVFERVVVFRWLCVIRCSFCSKMFIIMFLFMNLCFVVRDVCVV